MKEITLEDFGLTPEQMKEIVMGAQRYMPARDEEGKLLDVSPDSPLDTSSES